jgi:hypothetical protein
MTSRRRWLRGFLAASIVVGALTVVLRAPILRAAGWALVADDPIEPSDVVVVASGADGAEVLEAADLVHRGIAPRTAVFADPSEPADREFLRRGVPYEDAAARSMRRLRALGIDAVERIPSAPTGTEDEGRVLPVWCDERGFRSVVVVTTADHSRRLRRVLRRSMRGRGTRVSVRASRYSQFDPDRWWETRGGARIGIVELEKLLLDVVLHPIS